MENKRKTPESTASELSPTSYPIEQIFIRASQILNEKGVKKENEIKDLFFKEIVISQLLQIFVKELRSVGFSDKELFRLAYMLQEEEAKGIDYLSSVISIPFRLRNNFYEKVKSLGDEEKTAERFLDFLKNMYNARAEIAKEKDEGAPIMGFHNSNGHIKTEKIIDPLNRKKEAVVWDLKGTEIGSDGMPRTQAYDNFGAQYTDKDGLDRLYVVTISRPKTEKYRDIGHYEDATMPIVAVMDRYDVLDKVDFCYRSFIGQSSKAA